MTPFQFLVLTLSNLALDTVRQLHHWGDAAVRLVLDS